MIDRGYIVIVIRTQTHIISKNHRLFKYCDDMCFKSKNLYNCANYITRQSFINEKKLISSFDLNKMLKNEDYFKELPSKTSQQIILGLGRNWKSFFVAIKDWSKNKDKYTGKPKLPRYKDKNGRNIVFFDYMQGKFKDDKYYFQERKGVEKYQHYIETDVKKDDFKLLTIIPKGSCYQINIIYRKEVPDTVKSNNYLAIDLGINNLATLTNNIGLQPIVINGRPLKSINNYYNKLYAKAQAYTPKQSTKRIKRLTNKRDNIINTHMHRISKWIINYCVLYDIENIIIGRNKDWQRNSNMGKRNNQKFAQMPFEKLIYQIQYKAQDQGIYVEVIDERYTSKSSFIDNDILPKKFGTYEFSGNRIKRGLYESKDKILINADVNGSYNILRKSNPEFQWNDRIKGISLYPVRVSID